MEGTKTIEELGEYHDLSKKLEERVEMLHKDGGPVKMATFTNSDPQSGIMPVSYEARKTRFGENKFPEPESKTFLELCMEALEDTTMIILIVSAVVSLLIGVVKGWPDNIMSELYEGIAILSAVVIVTLVTAVNEAQKEAQFQEVK
jgi:magnesium-transporting ATPase (P-type)